MSAETQTTLTHEDAVEARDKLLRLSAGIPDWRSLRHDNGTAMFALDGTMLNDQGNRSIFDDVDE